MKYYISHLSNIIIFFAIFPILFLLISTNFRTKPLALNVNSGIRILPHNFTNCLMFFSVNNNATYSQKERPKGLRFGDCGGRYCGPPPPTQLYI